MRRNAFGGFGGGFFGKKSNAEKEAVLRLCEEQRRGVGHSKEDRAAMEAGRTFPRPHSFFPQVDAAFTRHCFEPLFLHHRCLKPWRFFFFFNSSWADCIPSTE